MLYVLIQAKTMSIPINDNMVVCIEESYLSSGRLYDIIAKLDNTNYVLGSYTNRETAREILKNIHKGRASQSDMWTEMLSIYEKVKKENG